MRRAAPLALLLALGACASNKKAEAPPVPQAPPPSAPATTDASYDWHVLLLAPFGSVLKEVPFKLHEVLLFKDQASQAADGGECYAGEDPPPRFLKRTPSQLLLCFQHDHLSRIEAMVMLPKEEVHDVVSGACLLWHTNAGDKAPWVAPPCVGSDGTVRYEAQLDEEEADGDEVPLSIKLEQVAPPES
ncbi:MAG TPA: hypothetical protein VGI93_10995 [Steroidobacteraceae bacterium]|jgi:hypothetical protein